MAPIMSLVWYSIAYILFKIGSEQRWMIIVAPIFSMVPLGGENASIPDDTPLPEKEDEDEDELISDDEYHGETFFDCLVEPAGFGSWTIRY